MITGHRPTRSIERVGSVAASLTGPFWSWERDAVLRQLATSPHGLSDAEARQRFAATAADRLRTGGRAGGLRLFLGQLKSPIILLLVFAAVLSAFLGERTDAVIILAIVLGSGFLSFWQERDAADTVARLLALIETKVSVRRDGVEVEVPLAEVVAGDIVVLNAGDAIPGDGLLLTETDLFVDEAALTGESYPAEKQVGVLAAETALGQRNNAIFLGTHVVSGTATAVMVQTGRATEFGRLSEHLRTASPETSFERGIRRFGNLLLEVTFVLIIVIFAINVYFDRPVIDSFLFSLALAVGLTPQLLPAIISITLAQGTRRMARQHVIVKQLTAIENFGSMDVLCVDKTGTLTEGLVRLDSAQGIDGQPSDRAFLLASLNASYETGFTNPIDAAILAAGPCDLGDYRRLDEVSYDFIRKRLSVLVGHAGTAFIATKGALAQILAACSTAELADGTIVALEGVRRQIDDRFVALSADGFRVLGVAYRELGAQARITKDDEAAMTFVGFLAFHDPPKAGLMETLRDLRDLGIGVKIITGDNRLVAASVSRRVGFADATILTGDELHHCSDPALVQRVAAIDIFAEVEPNQKERIIRALQRAGNVVGFLGDGINDAPALHAADVGISVNSAVAVAKEAAKIVLLEKDLAVLVQGVREGRRTFANTLKYVFVTTSANFGNMFSMAGISLFLPFLPLLPKQILLINFLSDIPAMTIATDRVDPEQIERPRRWDIAFIRNFMVIFGLVSSAFDFLTFGTLFFLLRASVEQFRTSWFLESVLTELAILLVIRTQRPFFRSFPSRALLGSALGIGAATLVLPYTPVAAPLGLVPLSPLILGLLLAITGLYILISEVTKSLIFQRIERHQ